MLFPPVAAHPAAMEQEGAGNAYQVSKVRRSTGSCFVS